MIEAKCEGVRRDGSVCGVWLMRLDSLRDRKCICCRTRARLSVEREQRKRVKRGHIPKVPSIEIEMSDMPLGARVQPRRFWSELIQVKIGNVSVRMTSAEVESWLPELKAAAASESKFSDGRVSVRYQKPGRYARCARMTRDEVLAGIASLREAARQAKRLEPQLSH